jgi:hypothetical protein
MEYKLARKVPTDEMSFTGSADWTRLEKNTQVEMKATYCALIYTAMTKDAKAVQEGGGDE